MKYIITADWHIRYDTPSCRTDNFYQTQKDVLEQIYWLAVEYKATILLAGDIFHKCRPAHAQELEILLIDMFKDIDIIFIPGNHDLQYNDLNSLNKVSLGVLNKQSNWNMNFKIDNMLLKHIYAEKDKLPNYIENGITAKELISQYKDIDIFVLGDNHTKFIYENKNKLVINPGSITRQTIKQVDYKPSVILLDSTTKKYDEIFLIDNDVNDFDLSLINQNKNKIKHLNTFVDNLKDDFCIDIDFNENIKNYLKANNVNLKIKQKIEDLING